MEVLTLETLTLKIFSIAFLISNEVALGSTLNEYWLYWLRFVDF